MKISKFGIISTALATTIMLTGCASGTKVNPVSISPSPTVAPESVSPSPTILPSESTIPTDSPIPTPSPTPIPSTNPKPKSTLSPKKTTSKLSTTTTQVKKIVKIVSVTSPVARNGTATLKAKVSPHAKVSIVVHYKTGSATAKGLETKTADANGNISWTWKVESNIAIGTWPITVSSSGISTKTAFKVVV